VELGRNPSTSSLMNIDRAGMIAEGEAFLGRDLETKAA
jgi:hypothetical protein